MNRFRSRRRLSRAITALVLGAPVIALVPTAAHATPGAPQLSVTSSHDGDFTRGQQGSYQIQVSNTGAGPTDGTQVSIYDSVPDGLTATDASGNGWSCGVSSFTICTRSDALPAGASYPLITVTVKVSKTAADTLYNRVGVGGGGDNTGGTFSDTTNVVQAPITSFQEVSSSFDVQGLASAQGDAACPAGTVLSGGGYATATGINVQVTRTSRDPQNPQAWQVSVSDKMTTAATVNVYAECAS